MVKMCVCVNAIVLVHGVWGGQRTTFMSEHSTSSLLPRVSLVSTLLCPLCAPNPSPHCRSAGCRFTGDSGTGIQIVRAEFQALCLLSGPVLASHKERLVVMFINPRLCRYITNCDVISRFGCMDLHGRLENWAYGVSPLLQSASFLRRDGSLNLN